MCYKDLALEHICFSNPEIAGTIADALIPKFEARLQGEIRVHRRTSPAVFGAGDVQLSAHPLNRLPGLAEGPAEVITVVLES